MNVCRWITRWLICSFLFIVASALSLSNVVVAAEAGEKESLPTGAEVQSLKVFPESVALPHKFAYRQLLVTATMNGGDEVDVTRMAKITVDTDLAEVNARGFVTPVKDGTGSIEVSLGGQSLAVPIEVTGQTAPYRVSYVQDVMPIMSRIGCNAGTCHGSAQGKNGFKLSLRGYDLLFDYRALTDDLESRRFDRASPDNSLFLLKITGVVPHVGGALAKPGEPYYEALRGWVADGVTLDLESPRVESIRVFPESPIIPLPGMRQQIAILATFSDGSVRDVTREAFVESSNIEVTSVDRPGLITALRRGEAAVLARYEGRYAVAQLTVMGDRSGFEWKEVPEYNYLDTLVYKKLKKIKALPSGVCTDSEFLRRVYLDLTGLPPRPKEVRNFLFDRRNSKVKRDELIDRLIGNSEFVDFWTNKWADLLQVNPKFLGKDGAAALRQWIQQGVASNVPYNEFVESILAGTGSTLKNPPAAYYKILRTPEDAMENTTQLFLGVRFNCNKCHDHPFERWTQNNYWQLSSFFARIGRKNAPGSPIMPRQAATQTERPAFEEIIFDKEDGEVTPPYGGTVTATFPYTHPGTVPSESPRRQQLAAWLASADNPYFAKSFVNRLWSYFFGVGFIEPVDDIRAGNPASNPELLDRLTKEFIDTGFDVRHLMRLIVRSRTYQHSIKTNEFNAEDTTNFSHALARRLPAETLFDALHQATGARAKLPGVRAGSRAAELTDPKVKTNDGFLDLFGRPPRESACECERSSGMSLGQSLNLVNGPTVAEAIRSEGNAIADLVAVESRPERLVEELFVSFLSRLPTEAETKSLVPLFAHEERANLEALAPGDKQAIDEALVAYEREQSIPEWKTLKPDLLRSTVDGVEFTVQEDGAVLVSGADTPKDVYTFVASTDLEGITGVRIEALTDESLPKKGPGRRDTGSFDLTNFTVAAVPVTDAAKAVGVQLENPTATDNRPERAIDDDLSRGWEPRAGQDHEAVFELKEPVGSKGGTLLTLSIAQQRGEHRVLGKFRISVTTSKKPVRVLTVPQEIAAIIVTAHEKRTPEQQSTLFKHFIGKRRDLADRIRLNAAQDLAWALINTPAFLFNR